MAPSCFCWRQRTPDPVLPDVSRVVSAENELFLQELLRDEVGLTLNELRERYAAAYGVQVSLGAMHDTLQRLGLTRKIVYLRPKDRHRSASGRPPERYHHTIGLFPLDERLYFDETGARLNMKLQYARVPRDERVVDRKPVSPSETMNTLALLMEQGLIGQWCYQGAFTARVFITNLETYLLPRLLTGKILLLDNHPVHRSRQVQALLKYHQIRYVYLPNYSPELNPITKIWSKFTQFLKQAKARAVDDLLDAIPVSPKTLCPTMPKIITTYRGHFFINQLSLKML